ncbi:hypothetical protein SAMN05444161_3166 [Rhizobiales bacterium GAS191]|nr:hypothetical protein SAMN05444161_3166 [Rhizobiales bacterium GAS191]
MADVRDPFEKVDSPWGVLPAWKADAIALGALNALMERIRNDTAAEAPAVNAAVLDGVKSVLTALDGIGERLAKLERSAKTRHRLDAASDEAEQFRLPDGVDPDEPGGALPAPSLGPDPKGGEPPE